MRLLAIKLSRTKQGKAIKKIMTEQESPADDIVAQVLAEAEAMQ